MADTELPAITPDELPPELQEALRRMSLRGPVVDLATGQRVAQDGRLVTDTEEKSEDVHA